MQDTEDLFFSSDALAARSKLYSGLNDINLFVEDTNKEYIYETIFKKMFGEEYKITAIFPCGGKPRVIEQYYEQGNSSNGIKNVFLMDGDFDRIIHKDSMILDPHVIYLQTYNIENYFIDKVAICNCVKGKVHKTDSEIEKIVDFEGWKERIVQEAKSLFLCYCYIQLEHPSEPNVSRSSNLFLDYNTGFKKTDNSFDMYLAEYSELDPNMQEKIETIDLDYQAIYGEDYSYLICGKFLFDSLYYYIKNVTRKQFNKEDMMWNLITSFDITNLDYVKVIIENVMK